MNTRKEPRDAFKEKLIERYKYELLGIPVFVVNAAIQYTDSDGESYVGIPDEEQLIAAMAVARCLLPKKLTGNEIRFLRKALGLSQKEFAERMEIDPATASRWEGNGQALGGFAEKVLRYLVCNTLSEKAPGVDYDPKRIADLKILIARDATQAEQEEPLVFERVVQKIGSTRTKVWDVPKAA